MPQATGRRAYPSKNDVSSDTCVVEVLRRGLDGISAPRWWAAEAG
jgi:hypothetical protein